MNYETVVTKGGEIKRFSNKMLWKKFQNSYYFHFYLKSKDGATLQRMLMQYLTETTHEGMGLLMSPEQYLRIYGYVIQKMAVMKRYPKEDRGD